MIITQIEEQKKTQNRYNIFIDGEYAFALDGVDVLLFKLKENTEISAKKLDEITEFCVFQKAKNTACRYIGFKARTKKELEKKLLEEFSDDITAKTVEFAETYGYIDDESFALDYAREKSRLNGWGKKRIVYELSLKGIDKSNINRMLESGVIDENSKLIELIEKKLKGKKDIDLKERQRLFAFLARKGFGYDEINGAFSEYKNGGELC